MVSTFLSGLGFSGKEVARITKAFGNTDVSVKLLETESGRKQLSSVADPSSVYFAHMQYCRLNAKELFSSLERFCVPTESIYRFFLLHGESEDECLAALNSDPYSLVFDVHAPFSAVDAAAVRFGVAGLRVEAAVYASLLLAEHGQVEQRDEKLRSIVDGIAGSTCLPLSRLIKIARVLLDDETSAEEILDASKRLHRKKAILLTRRALNGEMTMFAARMSSAMYEVLSAESIYRRMTCNAKISDHALYSAIDESQAALGLFLSYEQVEAVHTALSNRISVITGGPGTGKTQTTKVLLGAFKLAFENGTVCLMAPTGQAAKRMEASTGYPASTIHSALGVFPGETDPNMASDITADLVIIDESSMIDAQMLYLCMAKIKHDATIVLIGDVDQLPSIGAGNVLSDFIDCLPVSRLTKIFRQSGDAADIAYNAARIKVGAAKMIEGNRFEFIEASGSDSIQKACCDIYKQQVEKFGLENVVVLTPLRRKTKTGVNQLNNALRKICSEKKRYVSYGDMRIYQGDKVIFLKNRYGLSNGSCGFVRQVGTDSAECEFSGKRITLSGSQLTWIVPAYAETIYKSQGEEYKVVILVADSCHTATKTMIYTAVTRAKEHVYVVGEKEAFSVACKKLPENRYSLLKSLIQERQT